MANDKQDAATPPAPAPATSPELVPVTLEEPIQRGDTTIDKITLRKPRSGELRGLTLQDLLTSDVTTIIKLVPRISDPILNDVEAGQIGPADIAQIGGVIRGFFLTAAERRAMDAMIAGQPSTN